MKTITLEELTADIDTVLDMTIDGHVAVTDGGVPVAVLMMPMEYTLTMVKMARLETEVLRHEVRFRLLNDR